MSLNITGRVWRFGNNIDTDELFAGRYIMMGDEKNPESYMGTILRGAYESLSTIGKNSVSEVFLEHVARVVSGYENNRREDMEALKGDIIVGGINFGIGSSRQQAAEALRFFGISACLAETIHRIFFRNFWNLGGIAVDQVGISTFFEDGDTANIDLEGSLVRNVTSSQEMNISINLPDEFITMYKSGGLIPYHQQL